MTQNLKTFLWVFLLSLPFWWTLNVFSQHMEDFFLFSELAQNPQVFTAQATLETKVQEVLPLKKKGTDSPILEATSAISVFVNQKTQTTKVLFQKDTEKKLAIASLTKLMGALVVARHYPLGEEIEITRGAVLEEEDFGQLREGDKFTARELLYPLLMESSNDASAAFALQVGKHKFVRLMNQEAEFLGLKNTFFVNHAGLDPDIPKGPVNYSTAQDMFMLVRYLKTFYPSIFEILGLQEHPLYTRDRTFHHTMQNTNELLAYEEWPGRVLGGKTGWTPEAKGALVLVLESPKGKGYLLNIVLGSQARFQDMKKLTNWVFDSFVF